MRALLLSIAAGLVLSACSVWPVNQDPRGMNYRRDANSVIMALQAYRKDKGMYPAELGALVPGYIAALPDEPLTYNPADGSLSFHYIPSWPQLRPVWCNSVGNTTDWRCAEHLI